MRTATLLGGLQRGAVFKQWIRDRFRHFVRRLQQGHFKVRQSVFYTLLFACACELHTLSEGVYGQRRSGSQSEVVPLSDEAGTSGGGEVLALLLMI